MRQLTYTSKTLRHDALYSLNRLQSHLTLFRLILADPDSRQGAGTLGHEILELTESELDLREGALEVALDGMWSALAELASCGTSDSWAGTVHGVSTALEGIGRIDDILTNPHHRENVERSVLPSLQLLLGTVISPTVKTITLSSFGVSPKKRVLGRGSTRVGRRAFFRKIGKLIKYTVKMPIDNFGISLLDSTGTPSSIRDRWTAHMGQYRVSGYQFLRYLSSIPSRRLWRWRRKAMKGKRDRRKFLLRRRRRMLKRTYRISRQRRQWARKWKIQRLMPYRRWLRSRGGPHASLGAVRSLAKSPEFRYWQPSIFWRQMLAIRTTYTQRQRLRVPSVIWWRRFIRWHNYWLTSRKRKPQKRYKPLRDAKRFMFKRFKRWPMARVRQVRAGMYRNPSRGKWWSRGSIFPRKYRRKRISKYAKLLQWRNSTFKTARAENRRRKAALYIGKMKSNMANYFALSEERFSLLGVRFEKEKISNIPEESLNELIRVKKKPFSFSRTAKFSQRRFLRRLRYFFPSWRKKRLKFFRRKIPQVFGHFRFLSTKRGDKRKFNRLLKFDPIFRQINKRFERCLKLT